METGRRREDDDEEAEPEEVFLVRLEAGPARAFVQRAALVIEAGPSRLPLLRQARSTPRVTSASGPTASGAATRPERPVTIDPGLLTGALTLHGRVMPASNATFVGEIDDAARGLQAGRGGAAPVGLPRRHARRPRGGGVPRLRGARLGHRAAHVPARRTARTRAWSSSGRSRTRCRRPSTLVHDGAVPDGLPARLRRARRPRPRRSRWCTRTPRSCAGWRSSTSWSTTPTARAATCSP